MGGKPRNNGDRIRLTFCQTQTVYCWHIRRLQGREEPDYSDYSLSKQPNTLCGLRSTWDFRKPVTDSSLETDGICPKCRPLAYSAMAECAPGKESGS